MSTRGYVDTSKQVLVESKTRRRWTLREKRWIAEESFTSKASVARIAQRYALNANQIFQWRKSYREGRLVSEGEAKLLPVAITEEQRPEAAKATEPTVRAPSGSIEIQLPKGNLRVTGNVELLALRTAIECLL